MTSDAQAIVFVLVWPFVCAGLISIHVRMGERR